MRDFSEMEIKKNDIEIVQLFSRKKLFAFALLAHLSISTECLISFKVSPHRLSLVWVCDVWDVHMTSEGVGHTSCTWHRKQICRLERRGLPRSS